jgi:hypothetical protein
MIVKRMMGMQGASITEGTYEPDTLAKFAVIASPYLMAKLFIKEKEFEQDILISALGNVAMMGLRRFLFK